MTDHIASAGSVFGSPATMASKIRRCSFVTGRNNHTMKKSSACSSVLAFSCANLTAACFVPEPSAS